MEIFWIILAVLFSIIGLAGAVLPMLPGVPLSYAALWMMWLRPGNLVSPTVLWVMGILMVILGVLDYVAPVWLTRKGGGSKSSTNGAMLGMLVGLFFSPWGIILGPFLGALGGEMFNGTPFRKSLKVASYSFLSFLLTTGLNFIYAVTALVMVAVYVYRSC